MSAENRQAHWEKVYTSKSENEVSWFQQSPALSLELIDKTGGSVRQRSLTLVAASRPRAAIAVAKTRLGEKGRSVRWIVTEVTRWRPEAAAYDLWHDRAA
jgi:hypothetical protein